MVNLWNWKDLPQPPVCTYKVFYKNIDFDIKNLHSICEEMQTFFKKYPHLHLEYLLLSRIIYRMKQKFRTSKDFKSLEKLNKSLQRYFSINLSIELQNLMDLLPLDGSEEVYLPTKNLVDYILVRLQGIGKLMEYIINICIDIADMLNIRIQTGHFWKLGFILFSLVSRIYVLSRFTLKSICNYYLQLLPFSKMLKNLGKDWLPANYDFPENLENWLDIDFTKMDQDIKNIQEPNTVPDIMQYFNLINDSDSDLEITNEYVSISDTETTGNPDPISHLNEIQISLTSKVLRGFNTDEDTGEIITVSDNDSVEFMHVDNDHSNEKLINKLILSKKDKKRKNKLKPPNNQEFLEISSTHNPIQKFSNVGQNKLKNKKLFKKLKCKSNKQKSKVSTCSKNKKKKS